MEKLYTTENRVCGASGKEATAGTGEFTASQIGIHPTNVPGLIKAGFLIPVVGEVNISPAAPAAPAAEVAEEGPEVTKPSGSPWIYDPADLETREMSELKLMLDAVAEDLGIEDVPNFRAKHKIISYLSQDFVG